MTNAQLATASLNDIVFDGRNRQYGAYELRVLYRRNVTRALGIATTMCALLMAFPLVAKLLKDPTPAVVPTVVLANPTDFDIPIAVPEKVVPPPPVVKTPAPPPQPSTVKNLVPVVVEDKKAPLDNEVPDQKELEGKESGQENLKGDPNAKPSTEPEPKGPGEGDPIIPGPPPAPYTYVEQMPELPGGGGQTAIVAAIQRAVKYPNLALRNGVEGKVFVSFTVDPKGEVTDVKIVKGLGSGLDEETIRAIKTLPRFIPGKQNGREVSVSFTVPVTYQIR
ncbi:energy transducer TonB [Hymenobacter sp. BT664]|uniref:Energy transducer TonB n=2 Tax=Hymenobacter montanus TaxID=2771359 RepID=A0A927BA78_9BACT|nr:energy transducer TonB [Hymenobacter montanus]